MGSRGTKFCALRGKLTRVRRLSQRWLDEEPETTALYFEHDEPMPTLFVKRWRDLPDIVRSLETCRPPQPS